jgi:CRISPR-associated protein Cas1
MGMALKLMLVMEIYSLKNGTPLTADDKNECYRLRPGQKKITSILLYGQTGYVSLEAFKWISQENIQLNVFNWNGSLYTLRL